MSASFLPNSYPYDRFEYDWFWMTQLVINKLKTTYFHIFNL